MIKKLSSVFIALLSMFSLQANNLLEYIPAQSKVRGYCLENPQNNETVSLVKWFKKVRQLPSQEYAMQQLGTEIAKIENKIRRLNEKYDQLQNENIENSEEYFRMEKAKLEVNVKLLQLKKAEIEKEYIPFNSIPEQPLFQAGVNEILGKIDNPDREQERDYIKEGLSNVYANKREWNTYTTKEQVIQIVAPPLAFSALLTFSYLFSCAASNVDPSEPFILIYNKIFK